MQGGKPSFGHYSCGIKNGGHLCSNVTIDDYINPQIDFVYYYTMKINIQSLNHAYP